QPCPVVLVDVKARAGAEHDDVIGARALERRMDGLHHRGELTLLLRRGRELVVDVDAVVAPELHGMQKLFREPLSPGRTRRDGRKGFAQSLGRAAAHAHHHSLAPPMRVAEQQLTIVREPSEVIAQGAVCLRLDEAMNHQIDGVIVQLAESPGRRIRRAQLVQITEDERAGPKRGKAVAGSSRRKRGRTTDQEQTPPQAARARPRATAGGLRKGRLAMHLLSLLSSHPPRDSRENCRAAPDSGPLPGTAVRQWRVLLQTICPDQSTCNGASKTARRAWQTSHRAACKWGT